MHGSEFWVNLTNRTTDDYTLQAGQLLGQLEWLMSGESGQITQSADEETKSDATCALIWELEPYKYYKGST